MRNSSLGIKSFVASISALALSLGGVTQVNASSDYQFSLLNDANTTQRDSLVFGDKNTYATVGDRFYFIDRSEDIGLHSSIEIKYLEGDQLVEMELPELLFPRAIYALGSELFVEGLINHWVYDGTSWREVDAPGFVNAEDIELMPEVFVFSRPSDPDRIFFSGEGDPVVNLYYFEEGADAAVEFDRQSGLAATGLAATGFFLKSESELWVGVKKSDDSRETVYLNPTLDQGIIAGLPSLYPGDSLLDAWGINGNSVSHGLFTDGTNVVPKGIDTSSGTVRYPDSSVVDDVFRWATYGDRLFFTDSDGTTDSLYEMDGNSIVTANAFDLETSSPLNGSEGMFISPQVVGDYLVVTRVAETLEYWYRDLTLAKTDSDYDGYTKFGSLSDVQNYSRLVGNWDGKAVYLDDSGGDVTLKSYDFATDSVIDFGHPMPGDTAGVDLRDLAYFADDILYLNVYDGSSETLAGLDDSNFVSGSTYRLLDSIRLTQGAFFLLEENDTSHHHIFHWNLVDSDGGWLLRDDENATTAGMVNFEDQLWVSTVGGGPNTLKVYDREEGELVTASTVRPEIDWSNFEGRRLIKSLDGKMLSAYSGNNVYSVYRDQGTLVSKTFNVADFDAFPTSYHSVGTKIIFGTPDDARGVRVIDMSATDGDYSLIPDQSPHQVLLVGDSVYITTRSGDVSRLVRLDADLQSQEVIDIGGYEFFATNKAAVSMDGKVFLAARPTDPDSYKMTWFQIEGSQVTNLGWPEEGNGLDLQVYPEVGDGKLYFIDDHKDFGRNVFVLEFLDNAPSFSSPVPFDGPIVTDVSLNGSQLSIFGTNLEMIESVRLGETELQPTMDGESLLVDVSTVAPGTYSLSYSTSGRDVETELSVTIEPIAAADSTPGFWTKKISDTEIKLYAKNIVGAGKVQFFHNGNEVAWIRAEDNSDPKLRVIESGPMTGANYLVRTREMVEGKNVFEIYVDGERVLRRAQGN